MTELLIKEEASIHLPLPELSDDEFFDFCTNNPEYRIERGADGRITVMSGTGGKTGNGNAELTAELLLWARRDRRGVAFDSSTMFLLPDRAMRSPDAAWVARSRLTVLAEAQKERFLPLCPGFVIELTSPSDRLPEVREKMAEWMSNGRQIGWLIHPLLREVHVYRAGGVEVLHDVPELRGEGPVDGFVLDLRTIWDPGW